MGLLNWLRKKLKSNKLQVSSGDTRPDEVALDLRDKGIADIYMARAAKNKKRAEESGTVKEELVTQAERFHQSFFEFLQDLRSYDVSYYHQRLSPIGSTSYGDCLRRSVEEMSDELRQIQGLLAGIGPSKEAIASERMWAQRKAAEYLQKKRGEDKVDECDETAQ